MLTVLGVSSLTTHLLLSIAAMAEVEEPQFLSLADRIAALNQQKNFKAPPPGAGKRAPPPPPPNRPASSRVPTDGTNGSQVTTPASPSVPPRPGRPAAKAEESVPPLPRRTTVPQDEVVASRSGVPPGMEGRVLPPPLPTRSSTSQVSPALPARRPSAQTMPGRRNSNASDISYMSTLSTSSLNHTMSSTTSAGSDQATRRLPPPLEQAKLPSLPPTRRELEARAKEEAAAQAAQAVRAQFQPTKLAQNVSRITEPPRPSLPPRLPSRPARPQAAAEQNDEPAPALPTRRLPPPPTAFDRARSSIDPVSERTDVPPPVPLSSRPTFAQIDAVTRKVATRTQSAPAAPLDCLICRDFSAPDAVAAQHPTSSLPRNDTVGYLAHVLCDSFTSDTDKARAIFTWFHHNIAYDVHGFFNKCIPRGQTLEQTIFSGKAVCEGYAKVYEGIARRAGLECVLVSGHGKGYGFSELLPGQPLPKKDVSGHAWNAVRIDGGEWKLIDVCWGAGALGDDKQYMKRFEPQMFTTSNDMFGWTHFPTDERRWYRSDGRAMEWDEYIVGPFQGETATLYKKAHDEGLNVWNFSPRQKKIRVDTRTMVRFQFCKKCEHWKGETHGDGKPLLLAMRIGGRDGKKEDWVVLENDGFWWWCDIPARDLGAAGSELKLTCITKLNDTSGRDLTKEEFFRHVGNCSMSWDYIAGWDLVKAEAGR